MSTVFPSSMPYDDVTIIDQSGYVEETVVETPFIPDGPIAYVPFISPRGYGEDNKLQYMTASKLAKFGNPNLKKYGLSLYLARQVAAAGGTVLGMRVTTDAYTHANFCISAQLSKSTKVKYETRYNSINGESTLHPVFMLNGTEYTFDEVTIGNPSDITTIAINGVIAENNAKRSIKVKGIGTDVIVKFTSTDNIDLTLSVIISESADNGDYTFGDVYTIVTGNALTVKYIKTSAKNVTSVIGSTSAINGALLTDYDSDAISEWDGKSTITIPLFYVAAKGAGAYGNAFKARFTIDQAMNSYVKTTGGSGFFYKFIDSDNNSKLDNAISFTFNDDYVYQNESMSIEEAFAKYTENVVMSKVYKNEQDTTFTDFINIVEKYCCDPANVSHTIKDVNKVDILFGSNIDPSVYYVDTMSTDAVNLSIETGIAFVNGAEETDSFKFDSDPYASALAKAFNAEIPGSDLIYDHVRYPFQFIFCPSADPEVMEAVSNLVNVNRKITSAYYFVCGQNGTVVPATYSDARVARTNIPAKSYKEMIVCEWARITDPFTNKKTFMPSVYFNAFSVIDHWNKRKGRPLAGRLNAIWTGFDIGTVKPASSNTGEYVQNHNVGMNTMIEDGLGNAELYEQITTSSLSEVNNMQVLHEMVKIALRLAKENRWSDLGNDDIAAYQRMTEVEISDNLRGCYERMEVIATRESSNGAGRNRILCKVNVKFKDLFKGVSYEFYILAQ